MLRLLARPISRVLSLHSSSRTSFRSECRSREMGQEDLLSKAKRAVNFRECKVSSYTTELLEICADDPTLYVLFIPGNPGVVTYYKDFVESLYQLLGGSATITAIGHISHTKKNWERGKLFSLEEQINHKINFIRQELQNLEVPIVLVGHSIGSYISLETLRRCPEKVIYFIGLYPFLAVNLQSKYQSFIKKFSASRLLSAAFSAFVASLGLLPSCASKFIAKNFLGKTCSATAVEATCTHLMQYHTVRNMLHMAKTELRKLSETPDWAFMRGSQGKIAFLFGVDDHWGPLQMFEEISKQAPDIALSIEREGHMHSFCCTEAGSVWVAQHVASLIKNQISNPSK